MKAPLPGWGAPLLVPAAQHLTHFDAWRRIYVYGFSWVIIAGLIIVALALFLPLSWRQTVVAPRESNLGAMLWVGAFLLPLLGGWMLFRYSFAFHRMWGFYERGFVAPLYPKQGWDLFVPWERVKELRVRRMALSLEGSSREGELFLFRFEDVQGLVHRFREDTLIRYFGYSGAETAKFHEEALVMARAHLPPEQITIEPDLATS